MNSNRRTENIPQYIRELFAATKDGKVKITCYTEIEGPYDCTYEMDWTVADAEKVVERYEALIAALSKIGKLHDELENEDKRRKVLNLEELFVWETYIRPFDTFEGDGELLDDIYDRRNCGDELTDDEHEMLERHYEWFNEQSLRRLPFERRSPMHVVNRAQRYEHLVSLNAPEIVIGNEGRCLAEEMVLYYCSKKED